MAFRREDDENNDGREEQYPEEQYPEDPNVPEEPKEEIPYMKVEEKVEETETEETGVKHTIGQTVNNIYRKTPLWAKITVVAVGAAVLGSLLRGKCSDIIVVDA